jgi:hypothetical protein
VATSNEVDRSLADRAITPGRCAYLVQQARWSAAVTAIAAAIALAFLAVAIPVLASVPKLAANLALTTLFAITTPVIDLNTTRSDPETLCESRRILDN